MLRNDCDRKDQLEKESQVMSLEGLGVKTN
jgi:hypothetical protein